MRKRLAFLVLAIGLTAAPLLQSGCAAPSSRVQEVKTLKIIGASVDATMKLAAQLYVQKRLPQDKWDALARLHDQKFQPAYNLAVSAVQANLDSVASPDLIALAGQLAAVLAPYQSP